MQNAPEVLKYINPKIQEFPMKTRASANTEDTNTMIDMELYTIDMHTNAITNITNGKTETQSKSGNFTEWFLGSELFQYYTSI